MKKLLVVVAVLLVATPLVAKEIELVPTPVDGVGIPGHFYSLPLSPKFPTEQELYYDDGDFGSYAPWASYGVRFACNFDPGYACWITRYKICYYDVGTANCHGYFYENSGGDPDSGTLYWDESFQCSGSGFNWYEVDVDPPVFDDDGDFYSILGWDDTTSPGGPPADSGDTSHFYQDFYGWDAGWYIYALRCFVNDDADGPYGDQYNPADGDTAAPDTNVVWHCYDDDIGVDSDTINTDSMLVEVAKSKVSGTITITGDPSDYEVTFDPDSDFTEGDTVNVTLSPPDYEILDLLTNSMDEVTYSFSVGSYVTVQPTSVGYIKAMYE